MKKLDKIMGFVSVVAIVCTIFYLFRSKIIFTAGNEALYAVGALFIVSIFAILQHFIVIGFILRGRVKAFNTIANKYSLKHSYTNKIFFIPYGKLNTLTGNINGHAVEITDNSFLPGMNEVAKNVLLNQIYFWYTPRKQLNMDTKIYIDGENKTPDYPQNWVLWRNPFMKIKFLKKYLAENFSR